MESFDPSLNNEAFDPSDNEDESNSTYSSRESWSRRRLVFFDLKVQKSNAALREKLDQSTSENQKLRQERDALSAELAETKVMS
jgi:hypothetical protein